MRLLEVFDNSTSMPSFRNSDFKENDLLKYVFGSPKNSPFDELGFTPEGLETTECGLRVWTFLEDATSVDVCEQLSKSVDDLCLSWQQIIWICKCRRKLLTFSGSGNIFLVKVGSRFLVVDVDMILGADFRQARIYGLTPEHRFSSFQNRLIAHDTRNRIFVPY